MARFMAFMMLAGLYISPSFADEDAALQYSIEQLRHSIGSWNVVTEFIAPDGSITRSAPGQYHFEWVLPDRVIKGHNRMFDSEQASAFMFYIRESDHSIEQVSVGADGRLWIMTGPLGGETRYTQEFEARDGGTGQLRFTRYNVTENGFESKMEYTSDGGQTWIQGNHQVFTRVTE